MYQVKTFGRNGEKITHEFPNIKEAKEFAMNHRFEFLVLKDSLGDIIYSRLEEEEASDVGSEFFFRSPKFLHEI